MDLDSVKLGLLMETAERHQKLAETAIRQLNEQVQGLIGGARDQVHRTVLDELATVRAGTQEAVEALRRVKRAANARVTLLTLCLTAISAGIALFVAWWVLPSPAEIAALRAERDDLASNVAVLSQRGARADLRRCGTGHLCVRVDMNAPRYGDQRDYFVIRGY
jgi:hypothetical protein